MKTKQKKMCIITITLMLALIFAWQLYELFESGVFSSPPIALSHPTPSQPFKKSVTIFAAKSILLPGEIAEPLKEPAVDLPSFPNDKYLKLVYRYKLDLITHKILKEELAIAKVQHEIKKLKHPGAPDEATILLDMPINSYPILTSTSFANEVKDDGKTLVSPLSKQDHLG